MIEGDKLLHLYCRAVREMYYDIGFQNIWCLDLNCLGFACLSFCLARPPGCQIKILLLLEIIVAAAAVSKVPLPTVCSVCKDLQCSVDSPAGAACLRFLSDN